MKGERKIKIIVYLIVYPSICLPSLSPIPLLLKLTLPSPSWYGELKMKRKRVRQKREPCFWSTPCVNSPLFWALHSLSFKSRSSGGLKSDFEPLMPGNKWTTLFCRGPFMSPKLTRRRRRKQQTESLQRKGDGARRKSPARLVIWQLNAVAMTNLLDWTVLITFCVLWIIGIFKLTNDQWIIRNLYYFLSYRFIDALPL